MNKRNWLPFWFVSPDFDSWVESPEKWNRIKELYWNKHQSDVKILFSSRRDNQYQVPVFNFFHLLGKNQSLGAFFEENQMNW